MKLTVVVVCHTPCGIQLRLAYKLPLNDELVCLSQFDFLSLIANGFWWDINNNSLVKEPPTFTVHFKHRDRGMTEVKKLLMLANLKFQLASILEPDYEYSTSKFHSISQSLMHFSGAVYTAVTCTT